MERIGLEPIRSIHPWIRLLATGAFLAMAASCDGASTDEPKTLSASPPVEKQSPNLVIITLDTTRADALSVTLFPESRHHC